MIMRKSEALMPRVQRLDIDGSKPSLGEKVYRDLKAWIIVGELAPGSVLKEADLVARFAVSTSPVKEALSRLRQDGLVKVIGRRGYAVTELTLQDFHELIEMRIILEGASAELAAPRVTDADVKRLRGLSVLSLDATNPTSVTAFMVANQAFHESIAEIGGNRRLLRATRQNFDDIQRMLFTGMGRDDGEGLERDHDEIIEALARRDGACAREAMARHILQARERVLERMARRYEALKGISATQALPRR
jgi:GntR family transcriptional regulator, rspAB operon transcriptional repressor